MIIIIVAITKIMMIVIGNNKIIIRNIYIYIYIYIYITFIIFHSVKKMLFCLVFVGVKVVSCFQGNRQTVPNIWYQIKCFLSVINISQRLDRFEKGCSVVGIVMISRFKNIYIRRTPVIKKFMSCRADALFEAIIYGKPVNFLKFV